MQDRVSLYPGRVTLTPVAGQENTYDMKRADQPTQEGDPLSKDTFLKDETSFLYGLDGEAVPDEIFSMLSGLYPFEKAILTVVTRNQDGAPSSATISVSPEIGGSSTITTGKSGIFRALVDPGTYLLSSQSSIFDTITPSSISVDLEAMQGKIVSFQSEKKLHGEIDITETSSIQIPDWLTSVDLFAVGGGSSGFWSGGGAYGGGGGYTATAKGINLAGEKLTFEIGSGGAPGSISKNNNPGGTTKISKSNGAIVLQANGGDTPNGGSGGGSSQGGGAYPASNLNGGSDGSNGAGSSIHGTGQGTTTRKFGEAGNTLYSGGGGGAYSSSKLGQGGAGGGGNGAYGSSGNPNATFYGGGGGGRRDEAYSESTRSGSGYQGIASVRW